VRLEFLVAGCSPLDVLTVFSQVRASVNAVACDPTSMFYDACSPSGGGGSVLTTVVYPTGPGIPVIP
jgi:hypothetical protein